MTTILGGLFNSRLNMNLREEKGYTYGAGAGFDLRRAAGPFAARAAVNTEVTVPAIQEMLRELERMRDEDVTDAELRASRDFLIGVFPLRFETPGPVVGSIAGLVVHGLPDDELARYRDGIEAVSVADVRTAARAHLHLERAGDRARRRCRADRGGCREGRGRPGRGRPRRGVGARLKPFGLGLSQAGKKPVVDRCPPWRDTIPWTEPA